MKCIWYTPMEKHLPTPLLLENNSGSIEINSTLLCLGLLLLADDLVLISDSPTGLQKSIQILGDYCSKWDLRINLEKTKVMEFFFSRRKDPSPLYNLYNQKIEVTKAYRYLGIVITSNRALKSTTDTLAELGQKSLFCLLEKASKLQYLNPLLLRSLYLDSLRDPSWATHIKKVLEGAGFAEIPT